MATMQKFKLLATQCAVAGSPTRSPTTSPVIHLRRRRKTLRMLLSRTADRRRPPPREVSSEIRDAGGDPMEKSKELVIVRQKLKDLFVASPDRDLEKRGEVGERLLPEIGGAGGGGLGVGDRRGGAGPLRPLSAAFRLRLLRRAWRPVLVSIPE